MGSTANTATELNGLFKDTWAKKLKNAVPDGVKLYKDIPFIPQEQRTGNLYHAPIVLGLEHGVTYAGTTDDAFALAPAVSGQIKDATVQGTAMVLRSVLGYQAAGRAVKAGPQAFESATKFLVGNMMRSIVRRAEVMMWYGQQGLGIASGAPSSNVLTITTASWAPGIWSGAENMPIEIRNSAGTTVRGETFITAVDFDNRTITLNSTPSGTTTNDVIWYKTAYGNEFAGVDAIVTNTGTLFGISAASYTLWKGNSYSAGSAALSFAKIQDAVARAVEKGMDGDATCYVNPRAWADLLNDQAALRQYDSSYESSVAENGARKLRFHSQTGVINIEPSIFIKEGDAFILQLDNFVKIGSQEISFERPNGKGEYFRDLSDAHGLELRCACDFALFCDAPGHQVKITSIVN